MQVAATTIKNQYINFALALVCLLALAGCGNGEDANAVQQEKLIRPVKVVVLGDGAAGEASFLPGTVRSARRVDLAFRVAGQIESFPVKEGQFVKKGQVLARLDATDYRHAVGALEASLKGAKAASAEAVLNYERQRELFERDMTPKATYDRALTALDQARASVDQIEQQLSTARSNLSYTRLTAPFSGIVAETLADSYQTLPAGQPVLKLRDVKSLEIVVNVAEKNVANWKAGDTAKATFESLPGKEATITVTEIAAEASASTRTYAVTLAVSPGEADKVLPGMTVEVTRDSKKEVSGEFELPVAAVFDKDGKPHVWKVDPEAHTVSSSPVTVGAMMGNSIIVRTGVTSGDTIVAAGVHFLEAGQQVRLLNEEGR